MTDEMLEAYFPFLKDKKQVISIVGAGGKTTLMYTLARYYARQGRSVVVTTTTHIVRPEHYPVAANKEELFRLLAKNRIAVAGADAPGNKLTQPDEMSVKDYQDVADIVLAEADGAKQFPCKVPADHEPVIPIESRIVLGVIGLDAVGKPLGQVCFRRDRAMQLLGKKAEDCMTEEDLAKILSSEQGARKNAGDRAYYVVLNKCDNAWRRQQGERIQNLLAEAGIAETVCISLKREGTENYG